MVKKVSSDLAGGKKILHRLRMQRTYEPATLEIVHAFLQVVEEFQAESGISDMALCASIITGYSEDGSPVTLSRQTFRKLKAWNGTNAGSNLQTVLDLENVVSRGYDDVLDNSRFIFKRKLSEAIARYGYGDGKYYPPKD